jgi:transposase
VEQFEQIRRDRDREGLSIRGLAVRHGVHRRVVRQALASPVPPAKRAPVDRPAPKLGPYRAVIDGWLRADRDAPRKQRHTARRVWRRLIDEHGAEVDWGEALVVLGGVARTVHLFVMRASFSGAAFCQASLVETQQAFLELHVHTFGWFGGVFQKIRFEYVPRHIFKAPPAGDSSSQERRAPQYVEDKTTPGWACEAAAPVAPIVIPIRFRERSRRHRKAAPRESDRLRRRHATHQARHDRCRHRRR